MRKIRRLLSKIIFYFFAFSIGGVLLFKFLPIPFTWTMLDRKVSAIAEGKDSKIHYKWRSYHKVSREMHLAAVAAEDQNFPEHWGFDIKALQKAYVNNQKGKKVRGASTISQQVAKNVFLWQGRSYLRKALEVYFTALIELIWGKQRILEVYVNVAEMGPNTFGAEAASQRFFGKPASHLTRAEAARLAAVLPSPVKWSAAKPGPYVTRRSGVIQKYMRALGGFKYIEGLRKF
ncbi:monofunctional biosynthetic peptidoglycan transglycosylase [Leadbetterella byssophila]|uniref:monofunctional biosynthetic peptidoglycan transglycosylase n=1 Tax=Leadbetterella byssophila TaxID=316068 RepID=UPI0039A3F4AB